MALYRDGDYPGAYSTRASHKAIVADLLKKFQFNGGKLPFEYVVNPAHHPATQEMMDGIIKKMTEQGFISFSVNNSSLLILGEKGKIALENRETDVNKGVGMNTVFSNIVKYLIIILLIIVAGYLLLRIFQHLNKYDAPGGNDSQGTEVSQ